MANARRVDGKRLGFLVTHGTDTMSWALPVLRYSLKNLAANVAITGAQIPLSLEFSSSDGYSNVENAMKMLTWLRGPEVFAVFGNGRRVFNGSMWKIDKWAEDAFTGNQLALIEFSTIEIEGKKMELLPRRRLDRLCLIRTGGTIEAEMGDEGVLRPTANVVAAYLGYRLSSFFKEMRTISLFALDSSDMTLNCWLELAETVAKECREYGFTTYADRSFDPSVRVVFCTPFMTAEDYARAFRGARGVVLVGYGGGNIHIRQKDHSPLEQIRSATDRGLLVVLASSSPLGATDFIYENGWEAVKNGALPAGDLSIAHAQVKLAYILGHKEVIARLSRRSGIDPNVLARIAFLSGVHFRSADRRRRMEKLLGRPIPPFDPFFNTPFGEALKRIIGYCQQPPPMKMVISSPSELEELVRDPQALRNLVTIIEPDSIVGHNPWGEAVEASQNLAFILREMLGWRCLLIQAWSSGLQSLEAVTPLAPLLRSSRAIFVEGGRQSIYDPSSFSINPSLPREEFLGLIESLLLHRPAGSAPALYVCLGHQAAGEALIRLIRRAVDEIGEAEGPAHAVLEDLRRTANRIHLLGEKLTVTRGGQTIARGYRDKRFAVTLNERREVGIRRLHPYRPPKHLPRQLLAAHRRVARAESGLIEDLLRLENFDVAMLHGDEVNEEALLFANWALTQLHSTTRKHRRALAGSSLSWLLQLPTGVEILCSTHLSHPDAPLTEVAATAIYYQAPETRRTRRDFTLQFHPELLDDLRTIGTPQYASPTPQPLRASDGVRLLLSLLFYGRIDA